MTSAPYPMVLIIEDDLSQSTLLEEFLRLLGPPSVGLRTSTTLAQGVAVLEQDHVDVVVTDLSLPDSRGPGAVAELRRCAPEVPVVVMSGGVNDALRAEAFAAGAVDFMLKGHVGYQEVVARILRAVEHATEGGDET